MRTLRGSSLGMLLAIGTATAFVVAACGLDAVGRKRDSVPVPEDAETEEDVSVPDAPVDAPIDVDAGPGPCSVFKRGPAMIDLPDGACIDSHEVRNSDYVAFLDATAGGTDASFAEGGVPLICLGFPAFAPKGPFPAGSPAGSPGGPEEPVTYINWCDAWAYCKWAEKHLCTEPEWLAACTRGGTRSHPYGNMVNPLRCRLGTTTQTTVKNSPGCEGGYDGIHDMLGNAEEWIDRCTGASCDFRGGHYQSSATNTSCTTPPTTVGNQIQTGGLGVRCCR